jgi:hypothetical protein
MSQVSAKVICDSIAPNGIRLTTIQVRLPKFLLAELNTHRAFSRSFNSSRAIPARTMRQSADFEPIYWGSNRPGMQASTPLTGLKLQAAKLIWRSSRLSATAHHWALERLGLHKQHTNRIIEPYMWVDGVISATEWSNFFALRIHADAQPEMVELATRICYARSGSVPDSLEAGDWHLPYIEPKTIEFVNRPGLTVARLSNIEMLKQISAARCARVSYGINKPFDIQSDINRASMLLSSVPQHRSPFEHVATALDKATPSANFVGWQQYRKQLEANEKLTTQSENIYRFDDFDLA